VQTTIRAILALYLAHLLTDFVFQSSYLVQQKKDGQFIGYVKHAAIHYLCAALAAALFLPGMILSPRFQAAVIALTLVHLLIDVCKIQFAKSRPVADGALAFVVDQIVHFFTVVLAACWIEGTQLAAIARNSLQLMRAQSNRILLLLIVYVLVMFACGYLIRFVTKPLIRHIAKGKPKSFDSPPSETPAQLSNAGMYIGWLERFLVLTALLLHSPATVGLIIAAKSIARYPQFRREQFAEYFLIGTLLSICTAFVGGVVLMRVFFGSSALPQ
jgi:uncharacterized protein DUF3307